MRTVVERIDMCTMCRKLRIHPVMQMVYGILVIVASCNTALVRDDDNEIAVRIRPADCFNRTPNPYKVRRIVEVMHIDVECAVTVEKNRFIRHTKSTRRHSGNRSTP